MNIPSQALSTQYISQSYQDLVQTYTSNSISYLLDGVGNVLGYIPSSSIGNEVLTNDQTASYAITASYLQTSTIYLSCPDGNTYPLTLTASNGAIFLMIGENMVSMNPNVSYRILEG